MGATGGKWMAERILFTAMVFAGALAACALPGATADAQSAAVRDRDCVADKAAGALTRIDSLQPAEAEQVASVCRRAGDSSDSRSRAANAYFYAGKAANVRAARFAKDGRPDEAARWYNDAATSLQRAVDNSRDPNRVYEAGVELARAFRLTNRFDLATSALANAVSNRRDKINAAARYESAMIELARSPDTGRQKAFTDLEVFARSDLDRDENPAVVALGRAELFRLANDLGALNLAATSPEAATQASFLFERATAVGVASRGAVSDAKIAEAFLNLGKAQMRQAGLATPGAPNEVDCRRRTTGVDRIEPALASFRTAQRYAPTSPDAFFGEACALEARNDLIGAVASYTRAADLAPNSAAYQLALARSLALSERRAEAQPRYQKALELSRSPTERARIHVEIADQQESTGAIDLALRSLNDAVNADLASADAYLRRGKILFSKRPNLTLALADFQNAERLTRGAGEQPKRAEALFYISQIEVRRDQIARQGNPGRRPGSGDLAIKSADDAVGINEDMAKETIYQTQACLARVYFGRVSGDGEAAAARYCIPSGSRDPSAMLYAGMYHLRRTFISSGGDQAREWEAALSSFTSGLDSLSDLQRTDPAEAKRLQSRLQVGRGVSLFCVGLESIGRESINSAELRVESQQFFSDYGVQLCAPRR